MSRDLAVLAWFTVATVAFFVPYLDIPLVVPVGALTAVYALFLIVSIAALALGLARGKQPVKRSNEGG